MTPSSHSSGSLHRTPAMAPLQIPRLALQPQLLGHMSLIQAQAAVGPSGPVPPLSHPLPSPERSPPSSSFPSWVPLFSSFAFSLVCNYIDYCNVFTYLCFCSPVQPLVLPRTSSKSFVSVTPLRASSSPRACPAYTAALDGTPKLPQKMSASCLTSLKRPFIPSPPAPASLRDGSRDSRVPGPWVRFPPCHFLAVFSGSVVIPLRTSSFRPGWGEHLPAAA